MAKEYIAGGWVPRTKIHLEEFYSFVNGDNLELGRSATVKCRETLGFEKIEYVKRDIDFVRAERKGIVLVFTEDGIFYVRGKDRKKIVDYYNNNLMPSLAFLYSKGAQVPKLMVNLSEQKPIVKQIDETVKITKEGQEVLPSRHLFEYVVFFEEYKRFLTTSLKMHRQIWEAISEIRDKEKIRYRDLPKVRDSLLDLQRNITFIKSRIKQLDGFMRTREKLATPEIMHDLKKVKEYNFETLRNSKEYFKELFDMTEKHANTTLNLVRTLYQENEQNELATLQVVFIIGAVASIIALGAMPGAELTFADQTGQVVLTGHLSAFDIKDFVFYGVLTLVLGAVVYYLMHFFFKSAKRFKLISITKSLKKEKDEKIEDIKKIVS